LKIFKDLFTGYERCVEYQKLLKDSYDKKNAQKDEVKKRESQAIEELTRTTVAA